MSTITEQFHPLSDTEPIRRGDLLVAAGSPEGKTLHLHFDHGLGDCCHFALALQLFKRRGYHVRLHGEENKSFVWKIAEVEMAEQEGALRQPWLYHPDFNNLDASDVIANKISYGLRHPSLPVLERSEEDVWTELCRVQLRAKAHISAQAHLEADRFLCGLPRPIICLHSNGTNFSEQKSIPVEVSFNLIRELLRRSPGSVVILDWDGRAPSIGHDRVKSLKPWWGHIDNERLAALLYRADLMIGIDSGPFHFASFFDLPAIGVFRHIHPNRACVPNRNAVYMVPRRNHRHWKSRTSTWTFSEYVSDEPTATEIAEQAGELLAGRGSLGLELPDSKQHAGRYRYVRFEAQDPGSIKDERVIELLPDGNVGQGRGACEELWYLRRSPSHPNVEVLTLFGKGRPTCHLTKELDDAWCGKWIHDERMPIRLIPFNAQ